MVRPKLAEVTLDATVTRLWLVPLVAAIGIGAGSVVARVFWQLSDYTAPWLMWLAVAGIGTVITMGSHRVADRLARITDKYAESVRSSLENNVPAGMNLLIIRASGDEAAALLSVSQLLSWLIRRSWGIVSAVIRSVFRAIDKLERTARWLPGFMVFFIAFLIPIVIEVRDFQASMRHLFERYIRRPI